MKEKINYKIIILNKMKDTTTKNKVHQKWNKENKLFFLSKEKFMFEKIFK